MISFPSSPHQIFTDDELTTGLTPAWSAQSINTGYLTSTNEIRNNRITSTVGTNATKYDTYILHQVIYPILAQEEQAETEILLKRFLLIRVMVL